MIRETLASLTAEENLRTLPEIAPEGIYIEHEGKRYLNLSSNDYLGIACRDMHREFMHEIGESDAFLLSNPSSRLITGNSPEYTRLEQTLSDRSSTARWPNGRNFRSDTWSAATN